VIKKFVSADSFYKIILDNSIVNPFYSKAIKIQLKEVGIQYRAKKLSLKIGMLDAHAIQKIKPNTGKFQHWVLLLIASYRYN
jgi:hypothetical protein